MQLNESIATAEAVLFASGDPISAAALADACGLEVTDLPGVISLLRERYDTQGSGLDVLQLEDCFQLCTRSAYADAVRRALASRRSVALTPAAMEALTIIAYNQPVTKSFVEHVRGVDSSNVVNSLVEKELLEEAGRLDVPGRPISYRTTARFLRCFGLSSLDALPPLPGQEEQLGLFDLAPPDGFPDDLPDAPPDDEA